MTEFQQSFQTYQEQHDIERRELKQYYEAQFNGVYKDRNQGGSAPIATWLDNLSDNALALQYRLMPKNSHPLGSKHLLDSLNDGSDYDKHTVISPNYSPVSRRI
ncbi:MAG: hypothetical protein HRU25_05675 [Psychrobium sp.]|nr:hypothetical protein [Psychrobium sp.]